MVDLPNIAKNFVWGFGSFYHCQDPPVSLALFITAKPLYQLLAVPIILRLLLSI